MRGASGAPQRRCPHATGGPRRGHIWGALGRRLSPREGQFSPAPPARRGMLPAGRRVAGKPRPARVPLPQGLRGPPGQPAGSPSLCSGFFASRPGSGRQIRRHLPRSGPKKGREKRGGGRGGPPGRGAPSSRGAAGAGSKGSASSRLRANGGGGGEEESLWGWVWRGWGAAPSSARLLAPGPGGAGRWWWGRPGRGWRRRCRRRSRRGGCRCRCCRRRHCLLLRPRRGASKRKRRRGARRTPQLDPSLQLQASAPPLPSQPRSQSPRAAGPKLHSHWPVAVAVRAGAQRERATAGIRFPPQSPVPPLSPPLAPEGRSQLDGYQDRTHFPIGRWGLPDSSGGSPRESEYLAWGPGIASPAPGHHLSPTPNWTAAGGRAQLWEGLELKGGTRPDEGCDQGP